MDTMEEQEIQEEQVQYGNGTSGTGGLLILYVNNLNNNGKITAKGTDSNGYGGASGGGSINVFYNKLLEKGRIEATGGKGTNGGNGGNGSVRIRNINSNVMETVIETVLEYPILTTNGMVNVKYTMPDDENYIEYGLNKTKQCTATDALSTEAFDGVETTCSKASEGKTTFFVQKDVKQWNVVCKSKDNPYFTFLTASGYWGGSNWKNIGNDWWYVVYYGKDSYMSSNEKLKTTYDIYELKYDVNHQE